MKVNRMMSLLSLVVVIFLAACRGPIKKEFFTEATSNDTLIVIKVEGEPKDTRLDSLDYLRRAVVQEKRIAFSLREQKVDWGLNNYRWLSTIAVIKVQRSPVTREWTSGSNSGTSSKDESMPVKSNDGINFKLGGTCTALITEEDSALYTKSYGVRRVDRKDIGDDYVLLDYIAQPLAEVMDKQVHEYLQARLSFYYGNSTLEQGRSETATYFQKARDDASKFFKRRGITISNFGSSGGLAYVNGEIQSAIDRRFLAVNDQRIALQQEAKNNKDNEIKVANAIAAKKAALEFQKAAPAMLTRYSMELLALQGQYFNVLADKWKGKLPRTLLPSGGSQGLPLLLSTSELK